MSFTCFMVLIKCSNVNRFSHFSSRVSVGMVSYNTKYASSASSLFRYTAQCSNHSISLIYPYLHEVFIPFIYTYKYGDKESAGGRRRRRIKTKKYSTRFTQLLKLNKNILSKLSKIKKMKMKKL